MHGNSLDRLGGSRQGDQKFSPEQPVDDRFPSEDLYQRWVDYLLFEGVTEDGWHLSAESCPTLKGVLLRPREQQANFLLAAMVRILWLLESRGQRTVAELFLLFHAARRLMTRRMPWTQDGLTALVLLSTSPNVAQELGDSVLKQVHWNGPPSQQVRRALKRLKKVGPFRAEIDRLLYRSSHFPDQNSVLNRSLSGILAHARRLPESESRRWWRKAKALMMALDSKTLEEDLLAWLERELATLHHDHSRLLNGLVAMLGFTSSERAARFLERAIKWGYRRREGYGPQDLMLARTAIRALARMSTPLALTYLVVLGSELRYASATEELLTALRRIA